MTLNAIEADLYRRVGFAAAPDTTVTTRLRAFINETHRTILTSPGMSRLRDETLTFTATASTAEYALGQTIARVIAITNTTNDHPLWSGTLSWYRRVEPDASANSGTPSHWIPLGYRQVATQPTAATGVWVVSTSASDVGTAYIETVRTGGYRRSESVTINGLTRAQLGTLTDHTRITKFYSSAAAVGAISLYDAAAAGNELARIPIGATYARYVTIALWPTPAAADTYQVDYSRTLPDLANANDEPLLPEDFHDLLGLGARMKEYEKKDDTRYQAVKAEYDDRVKELKYWLWNPPDFRPHVHPRTSRPSRLGAQYPVV